VIKGNLPVAVAEYLLNYKRDDLNAIERKYGLQVVIVGEEDMPAEQFTLDFLKTEQSSSSAAEQEDTTSQEKPWYRKLLPIGTEKGS
jgi:hypothetical protein